MKSHMLRADLLDDPIMQPAKSIRVPRFPSTWRWETIRIRWCFSMLPPLQEAFTLYLLGSKYCSGWNGVFSVLMTSFPSCRKDAFVDGQRAVLERPSPPTAGPAIPAPQACGSLQIHRRKNPRRFRRTWHVWSKSTLLRQDVHFLCMYSLEFCISSLDSSESTFLPLHVPTLLFSTT